MYTHVNPSFTIQKQGLSGQNYVGMFSLCEMELGSTLSAIHPAVFTEINRSFIQILG